MTKEEIVDGLYMIKNWKCNGDAKMHEFVTDAIKALEQEPILDKIRAIVDDWKADTWTDNISYECMVKIAELVEPQESEDKCSNCAKSWTDNCPRNKCWDNDYSEFIKEREVSE